MTNEGMSSPIHLLTDSHSCYYVGSVVTVPVNFESLSDKDPGISIKQQT